MAVLSAYPLALQKDLRMEADHRHPKTDQSAEASSQPLAQLRDEKGKPHWIICGTNANLRGIGLYYHLAVRNVRGLCDYFG